jgi:hypothetical protein
VKDAVQKTVPQMPGMLGETRETLGKTREVLGDSQEMMDSLSTHWPFKNIIPPPDNAPIKMDSHD